MVATAPVAAIKKSRIKHLYFYVNSQNTGVTRYMLGTATASTGHILGQSGKVTRCQITSNGGGTGDIAVDVYVLPGTNTPGANYQAMQAKQLTLSNLYQSSETVGTALNGANFSETDRFVVTITTGTNSASQTDVNALVTLELDD